MTRRRVGDRCVALRARRIVTYAPLSCAIQPPLVLVLDTEVFDRFVDRGLGVRHNNAHRCSRFSGGGDRGRRMATEIRK
jgi:hypothetical protein